MAEWEGKKYKLDQSENFDAFMARIGVGFVTRKLANQVTSTVELSKSGDEYTLNTTSTFKNVAFKFRPGEEFEEETPDGRKVRSVCTFDGDNRLVCYQKGDKPATIIRQFMASQMVATMKTEDVTCTRSYKAV